MKKLNFGLHRVQGRSAGRISSYHRGGGHKKLYRYVDFFRTLPDISGKILKIEYDPFRSATIFLVGYTNGIMSYVLGIQGLKEGDYVHTYRTDSSEEYAADGISCKLGSVKTGSKVHNIEDRPKQGGQIARSAGSSCLLLKKYDEFGLVKLPSGEFKLISLDCMCTIGSVSNENHKDKRLAKAGSNRWSGKRPHVRGQAMNPVDHPHGGRTNGGKVPRTPWGKIAKGVKTGAGTSKRRVRLKNV